MSEERAADGIYCWVDKRKMGATLFSAKLGRLVLSDGRLRFLSSGKSDVGRRMGGAALLGPLAGMKGKRTDDLGEEASANPGSLDLAMDEITRCEAVKRSLSITYRGDDGAEHDCAFADKMAMPDLDAWVAEINARRS